MMIRRETAAPHSPAADPLANRCRSPITARSKRRLPSADISDGIREQISRTPQRAFTRMHGFALTN
jgi:hypothetical protein